MTPERRARREDLEGLVYAATLERNGWEVFLSAVARALVSACATILVHGHQPARLSSRDPVTRPSRVEWVAWRRSRNEAPTPAARRARTLRLPVDLPGSCVVCHAPLRAILEVARPGGATFDRGDAAHLRRIRPHLRRALAIEQRLAAAELERAAMGTAFHQLGSGVFVLDQHGRILIANRIGAAMLDAGDRLRRGGDSHLRAVRVSDDRALHRSIVDSSADRSLNTVHIGRGAAHQPYALVVSPVQRPPSSLTAQTPAVVVVATDLVREHVSAHGLRELFSLTPAEHRVADLLSRGLRAAQIAAHLGVALPTVRTHLRRLLEKTGASGQPDLVRILTTALAALATARLASGDE